MPDRIECIVLHKGFVFAFALAVSRFPSRMTILSVRREPTFIHCKHTGHSSCLVSFISWNKHICVLIFLAGIARISRGVYFKLWLSGPTFSMCSVRG